MAGTTDTQGLPIWSSHALSLKAWETIEKCAMLRQGDRVVAAVSGGADSVALRDFLCALSAVMHFEVRACHLNHCLRGEESERDEQFVRTMCREYGVALDVRREEVKKLAAANGESIEVAARGARYRFFETLSAQYDAKLATAHTLSDLAETVLLNLCRGTGAAGLRGIPPVRGRIIRPLLGCTRAEVEEYCVGHGLCYVTDSSNLTDDYTRNYIRHRVMPQLSHINPDVYGAVERMAGQLARDEDCLAGLAAEAMAEAACDGGWQVGILRQKHAAVRTRVIAQALEREGVSRSAQRIEMIDRMLTGESGHQVIQVGKGCYAGVRGGIFRVTRRTRPKKQAICEAVFPKEALDGLRLELGCGKTIAFSVLNCADYEIFDNNAQGVLKNALDYDKITGDVFIRSRQPGDRIRQAGRGCSKSLKKLYSELALPDRERLCILADSAGVLFAEQAGPDERAKADMHSRKILAILIDEQKMEEKGNEG